MPASVFEEKEKKTCVAFILKVLKIMDEKRKHPNMKWLKCHMRAAKIKLDEVVFFLLPEFFSYLFWW